MSAELHTHRVVQSVDVEDDGFGPLVAGAQEELSFTAAAHALLGRLRVGTGSRLQQLVDLRRQQLRLSGSRRSGRYDKSKLSRKAAKHNHTSVFDLCP